MVARNVNLHWPPRRHSKRVPTFAGEGHSQTDPMSG